MRFVEQIEQDGRVIFVGRGCVLPERDVLCFRRVEAMQVEHHIRAAIGDQRDDLLDELTISRAVILLSGRSSKPILFFDRQANRVRLPVFDGDQRGLQDSLATGRPFEADDVDSLQPHRLAFGVQNLIADDVQFRRPLRTLRSFRNDRRQPLGFRCRFRRGQQRSRGDRFERDVIQIERATLHLKQRRHEVQRACSVGHEKADAALDSALGVLSRVRCRWAARQLVPRRIFEVQQHVRIKPRLLPRLQIRATHPPTQRECSAFFRQLHRLKEQDRLPRLLGNQPQKTIALFLAPGNAVLRASPTIRPLIGIRVRFEITVRNQRRIRRRLGREAAG